ncbi:von Willebrand factor [Posidoniimonas polymericola]|uniref:von Willebrand factor n=1 Tax=Posidoniimonas polymericola TaxID=2528002 RepID=A0A5C5ZEM2_9BACT|nr:von Willebrand factor type A domain-containing protein [Posidoniimonas polymericola]TWT85606.1 von Willebrand factor [Posidoniimonas polymericola]
MNELTESTDPNELTDRLIDLGLRDTLGGESAPDLSASILARAAVEARTKAPAGRTTPSSWRVWGTLATAASLLAGVVGYSALNDRPLEVAKASPEATAQEEAEQLAMLEQMRRQFGHDAPVTLHETEASAVHDRRTADLLRQAIQESINRSDSNVSRRMDRSKIDTGVGGQVRADQKYFERSHYHAPGEQSGDAPDSQNRSMAESGGQQFRIDAGSERKLMNRYAMTSDAPYYPPATTAGNQSAAGDTYLRGVERENRVLAANLSPMSRGGEGPVRPRPAVPLSAPLPPSEGQGGAATEYGVAAASKPDDMSSYGGDNGPPGFAPTIDTIRLHANGGNVVQHGFGDGRGVPISDNIDPEIYLWMVTRNGRETFELDSQSGKRWPEGGAAGEGPDASGDKYQPIHENAFIAVEGLQALSTFSIDVDTASYANVRRFLNSGRLPPPDAVRLEELVNYFDYQYQPPTDDTPFAAHVEVAACPWNGKHRLARIGIKGRELAADKRPLSNLVFLIDVSGSMQSPEKLPLVIEGMKALTRQLGENDRVAIVVYASTEGLALPSTPGDQQDTILAALDKLTAGGSTAGGAGIQLAYQICEDNFIEGGSNRVILCTDGDFNVGTTSTGDLERMVAEKADQTGVFLSVCGFGRGNLNDAMMETISGRGNGTYYYIDTQQEAEKVFVRGLTGTLVTIAKDVKIQVEFNPAQVAAYRLLGYENRVLAAQDFNDDKKDAGEIGAGHTVTALYELVPAGEPAPTPELDELRYQQPKPRPDAEEPAASGELLTLKMRYKLPDEDTSTKREWPVSDDGKSFGEATPDTQFAAAAAGFGMLLRGSAHSGNLTWEAVREIAQPGVGADPHGNRHEFLTLIDKAAALRPTPRPAPDPAGGKPAADSAAEVAPLPATTESDGVKAGE